ncbi:IclR family transcriptional regulator [Prauserella muralis]|uniref:IclR family transcriptional regulator n=1 Tax=Prauserella muralis TaxID=588067 RepID=UPI0011AC77C9|nr:IclR family transcriptional regulator [Prauserella muralis]TWE27953.1 IclR family transcriptional regulator [Prauserella muralis]
MTAGPVYVQSEALSPVGKAKEQKQTACARVLAVLSAFSSSGGAPLSLTDISRRAGLSLTTTHRLVGELTEWGALERDERQYRIGIRVLELAASSTRGLELREVAMPYLMDLHAATRENVHLAVRAGLEVVYVERLHAPGGVELLSKIGGRWPLHATGTGLVLLAFAGYDVQEQVLSGPLQRFTGKTICDSRTLRRVLADVKRTKVAITEGQITPGAVAIASPIHGPDGEVVSAVGVVVPTEGFAPRGSEKPPAGGWKQHTIVPAVVTTARRISRALASTMD